MRPPNTTIAHRAAHHWAERINRYLDTLSPRPTTEEAKQRGGWLIADKDPHGKVALRWWTWDGKVVLDGWWDLKRNDHVIRTGAEVEGPSKVVDPSLHPAGPVCVRCTGWKWVCEDHPDKAWESGDENECKCGAAGMPCPDCNPAAKPIPGSLTIWELGMRPELN